MLHALGLAADDEGQRKLSIGFVNFAHAIDHYVMLIFPTVVIGLEAVYGRPYSELIALGTASFFAFGLFSLPAGWLADRWSRRNMMAVFFIGCGLSLVAASLAPDLTTLAVALFALGVFAAIYHPVGTAMVIAAATNRGRTLAFNGVCGNLGVALAAGLTAVLTAWVGWRGAFLLPAAICLATGVVYMLLMPNDRQQAAGRSATPDVRLVPWVAAAVFAMFIVASMSAGLVFNILTIAVPKVIDERIAGISLVMVGGISSAVFACGALAQFAIGRVLDRFPPHLVFAAVAMAQFAGVIWVAQASGAVLFAALAVAMAAIYAQVIVTDLVLARYTADAWRSRVYAVRYFVTYLVSGAAVAIIAVLHARGGFDLVLIATAIIATGFVVAVVAIAGLVHGVERQARTMQPAE